MAFVVKILFVSALVYGAKAGYLSGAHSSHGSQDSFLSSALNSPSASFGPPSQTYGAPAPVHHGAGAAVHVEETVVDDHGPVSAGGSLPGIGGIAAAGIVHGSNIAPLNSGLDHGLASGPGPIIGGSIASGPGAIASGPGAIGSGPGPLLSGPGSLGGGGLPLPAADLSAPGLSGPGLSGPASADGSLLLDSTLPGATGQIVGQSAAVGPPRVIGTSVTVGRANVAATRYELQSVVQNVVRRVPVEVTRHVQVAVPHPVPVPVRQEVQVPVPQPYPVHVDVVKHVPYPVYKTHHVPVERPVPYEVVKEVPVEVIKKVHVPVERPYEVIKKIHVPIEKHVEVPVAVWKPYPLHIIKHVTHYKKKSCCW